MHMRRCTHVPPMRTQSSQPSLLGSTSCAWPRCVQRSLTASAAEVEAVEVHDLVPGLDEVDDELLLGVVGRVDLGDAAQLRVRAEHKIDCGRGPLHLTG